MPIYEYACAACGRVSGFLVRNTGAHRAPACPHCGAAGMRRAISRFAAVGAPRKDAGDDAAAAAGGPGATGVPEPADDGGAAPDLAAMESLMDGVDENDPRSMGRALRKMAEQTGEPLDEEMNEAVRRLEGGEDPDRIEERMGGGAADGGGAELYDG